MKNFIYIAIVGLLFFSCQRDSIYVAPEPSFTIITSKGDNTASIYEDIEIKITGGANRMVLFTGDAHHHVDSVGKDPLTTGRYVQNGDVVKFQYVVKGIYEITLLGSSYIFMGEDLDRERYSKAILVTDDKQINDVWDLNVSADGGKVFYYASPKLRNIDTVNVPGSSFSAMQTIQAKRNEDGDFYIDIFNEFRQARAKDNEEQYAKYTIEIPFANNGFTYSLDGKLYEKPLLENLYRDQDNNLFKEVTLEYAPNSNPTDVKVSKIYMLPVPELEKLVFKDSDGRKVGDIITENFNAIFGETKPVYTQYFPDYNDIHKFYGVIEYSASEADKLNNLKLSFEHRLPANMVEVKYMGKVLKGDGSESVDLSKGSIRLNLTFTDDYFISKGVDPEKAKANATLDIYAFPE